MDKRWITIFKTLGNINRIKIIRILFNGKSMTVTKISEELKISLKATSRHLIIMQNLDILESEGKDGFVHYSLSKDIPEDFKKVLKIFI